MKKIYTILNLDNKKDKTVLDSSDVTEKYCIEKSNVVLMSDEKAYYKWLEEDYNEEENDFISFAYYNLKSIYKMKFINCDGYTTDTCYYEEDELRKLIEIYPFMYDSRRDEIVKSYELLNENKYFIYDYLNDDELGSYITVHLQEFKDNLIHILKFNEEISEEIEGWGFIKKSIRYDIYKDSENNYYKITYDKYGEQLPMLENINEEEISKMNIKLNKDMR